MSSTTIENNLHAFFAKYAADLASFDAQSLASNYGFPTLTLSNEFAGSLATSQELEAALPQAFAYYRSFGFASAKFNIRQVNQISARILGVRVTWTYMGAGGEKLVDTDYEYVLKKDGEAYKIYAAISIDEAESLPEPKGA